MGGRGGRQCIYAYKREEGGGRAQANQTTRSLWKNGVSTAKRRGKQALEPEEGGYQALFLGRDGAAWSMQVM